MLQRCGAAITAKQYATNYFIFVKVGTKTPLKTLSTVFFRHCTCKRIGILIKASNFRKNINIFIFCKFLLFRSIFWMSIDPILIPNFKTKRAMLVDDGKSEGLSHLL